MTKNISKLTSNDIDKIKILAFDGDGVTMPEGTKIQQSGNKLTLQTQSPQGKTLENLNKLKQRFDLLFTSGRSLLFLTRMYEPILWENIILQGEMGIFTLYHGEVSQLEKFTSAELEKSRQIKQEIRKLVRKNDQVLGFEPKQLLVTVHCQKKVPAISEIVSKYDPINEYQCLWSGEAYDISPKRFNKATGLEYIVEKMGLTTDNVLAIGNDPNDLDLVKTAGISITTNPETLAYDTDFAASSSQHQGGQEIINHLRKIS